MKFEVVVVAVGGCDSGSLFGRKRLGFCLVRM